MKVRKSLAEALVLSKLNYYNVVYAQMPMYLINRLQRIQNTTAGYVFGPYATMHDVIILLWLPIKEDIEFSTTKLVNQSLHSELWLKYLSVKPADRGKNLLSRTGTENQTWRYRTWR